MLAIAEAMTALPERPRRAILFAAVAAEEQGLLGSEYLAAHPPVPPGRLAADINLDGINIWGRTKDVVVIGLGKSSLDDWIRAPRRRPGKGGGGGPLPRPRLLLSLGPVQPRADRRPRRLPERGDDGHRSSRRAGEGSNRRPSSRRTTTSPRTSCATTGTSRAPWKTPSSCFYLGVKVANTHAPAGMAAGRRVRGGTQEGPRGGRRALSGGGHRGGRRALSGGGCRGLRALDVE